MTSKKGYFVLLCLLFSSLVFAQNIENRKRFLIDSLMKERVDTISTFHQTGYGFARASIQLKKKRRSKKWMECSIKDTYIVLWKEKSKMYYKAFNECYELPLKELKETKWLDYFKQHKETIQSVKSLGNTLVLNKDTIMCSMSCDSTEAPNTYRMIDHYEFYELEIYMGPLHYISGELNEFLFCNNKTKHFAEVKVLGKLYYQVKEIGDKISADVDKNGEIIIENFHPSNR